VQQIELARGERNGCAGTAHPTRCWFQHDIVSLKLLARPAVRAANQCAQPSAEFMQVDRFDYVVVGPDI
jgi:hypothetical protein